MEEVRNYETDCKNPIIYDQGKNPPKENRCELCEQCIDEKYAEIVYIDEHLQSISGHKTVILLNVKSEQSIEEEASKMYQKLYGRLKEFNYMQIEQTEIGSKKVYMFLYGLEHHKIYKLVKEEKNWRTIKIYKSNYYVIAQSSLKIRYNQELKKGIHYNESLVEILIDNPTGFYISQDPQPRMFVKVPKVAKEILYTKKEQSEINKSIVKENKTLKRLNNKPVLRDNWRNKL